MRKMDIILTPEHEAMRQKVAEQYGFSLYKLYGEKQVAAFRGKDLSTQKRHRRKGLVPYVQDGIGAVAYLGIHIADVMILGTGGWDGADIQPEPSNSGPSGLTGGAEAPRGSGAGTMKKPDRSAVLHLAQQTLKPQKQS